MNARTVVPVLHGLGVGVIASGTLTLAFAAAGAGHPTSVEYFVQRVLPAWGHVLIGPCSLLAGLAAARASVRARARGLLTTVAARYALVAGLAYACVIGLIVYPLVITSWPFLLGDVTCVVAGAAIAQRVCR